MRPFLLLALGLAALFGAMSPALALETGTPAWLIKDTVLRQGPGHAYLATGEVDGKLKVRVDRCSRDWCQIRGQGQKGWVALDRLSFGQHPRGPFTGPRLNRPSGGPGTICLYTGANYTGSRVCATSGTVVRDLLLFQRDNAYASVKVSGNVSVMLCRDRWFTNYCQLFNESRANLPRFLNKAVSSYRVY